MTVISHRRGQTHVQPDSAAAIPRQSTSTRSEDCNYTGDNFSVWLLACFYVLTEVSHAYTPVITDASIGYSCPSLITGCNDDNSLLDACTIYQPRIRTILTTADREREQEKKQNSRERHGEYHHQLKIVMMGQEKIAVREIQVDSILGCASRGQKPNCHKHFYNSAPGHQLGPGWK